MSLKSNTIGEYSLENTLADQTVIGGTTPLEIITPSLDHMDGLSFVIVVEDYTRDIVVTDTDHVVKATKTWTFANGAFSAGDVGGTFTIAGTTGGSNDGTYTIATVTNATTIVSVEAVPGANETFDPDTVTLSLADAAVHFTTAMQASDDYVRATLPGLDQVPGVGHWGVCTSLFVPTVAAVTAASTGQYTQAHPFVGRFVKLILTPTQGQSLVTVYFSAKGNR